MGADAEPKQFATHAFAGAGYNSRDGETMRRPPADGTTGPLARLSLLAALAASVGACAPPPAPQAGPHPADGALRVRPLAYRSVTGDSRAYLPVEPKGWEELNRSVTPKAP